MIAMTDNRTTELLREGLTEHGIEWRSGLEGVTFVGDWCFVEYDNGKLAATCEPVLTPEQAVAATLGSEQEKALEERIGALESENAKLREADAVNDLASSYVAIKADRDACKKLLESYMEENDALYMENVKLESRVAELEELVQDWQALYEYPDYGDCIRLRKRMQELGIEVIDE